MESAVPAWKWIVAVVFLLGSAFCSGTETALTALGEARARQLRDGGGRRARLLGIWIDHPERVLSTLLIGNTLVNIGAGALAASLAGDLAAWTGWNLPTVVAATTAVTTLVILFFGEIIPKTLGKRHPVRFSLAAIPLARTLSVLLWPVSAFVTRATGALFAVFGGGKAGAAGPAVTSEEIEYLIEMGTREGVLDEVKEELLNSVLEFADRVAKEIMVPRTRMVAIDREAAPEDLVRIVTENPYSRMPVYEGSVDNIVGILLVREIIQEVRHPQKTIALERYLKPAFFVPEGMKISRLLKEMQRRRTHLAVVVDEFGGTSGLVTLEDVIEEIVGEIQDEADVEAAPVKAVAAGVWLADAAVPLHDLEAFLNERLGETPAGQEGARPPEIRFPEEGDYETLGGFVTATAGRVPAVGAILTWDGLTFTVRAGDERRVTRVEIARRADAPGAAHEVAQPAARA
ncbi:hemolysin family protein [Anaeromyxobacter oryzae]|uniref:Hemolysin n=1 Tax=Anaeromyxobacter oryzae TaxID=2918170 RepID=A0ABM7X3X0_9BACT|nr:hemolysin family protein [Anaeromyxobacter oryzae]BDG06488.1 hemolysin [Anaeromyxobacter oryzae]